jgi:hypothetical protein
MTFALRFSVHCSTPAGTNARHSGETHQVAGAHGELELLIDAPQSAKHGLPNPADGEALAPELVDYGQTLKFCPLAQASWTNS